MNKKFINVTNYSVRWSNRESRQGASLTCHKLLEMINWLIDNTFVTIGYSVFQQVIGIPMGTDCAPYLANLFLFAYEFEFLNDTETERFFHSLQISKVLSIH